MRRRARMWEEVYGVVIAVVDQGIVGVGVV